MKNFKNLLVLPAAAFVFLCAIFSASCSSAYDYNKSMPEYGAVADMAGGEANFANESFAYDSFESEAERAPAMEKLAETGSAGSNLPIERKIIRDADITMETEDVEGAYERILGLVSGLGGYEANRNMRSNSYGYPMVDATLKIPSGKLDEFLEKIKKEGEVKSSNISSSDISSKYFDAQIRLDTLEKTLANYYVFLENAESVEEQLEVTRYINEITYEIEKLKGSLRLWDSLVDYSTVTFYLYPINEAPEEPRVIEWDSLSLDDMGWFISSGFLGVCNAIFSVLQWIVVSIAAISPILIIIAVLIFFLVRRHKKNKQKKQQQWQQWQQAQQTQMQAQNHQPQNPPENGGNMPQQ
ncbi:MAG: DUF4349 domain-containing protein [Oscillospiraceae bacterium]|nr:DUF4349 domain-containing protein [Oscillospiraceae bacterium]